MVAVVNNGHSPLAAEADVEVLLESGPEVISGSTRLGAGTAQKAALNLLSTLVYTRLGAVYHGYMVNVKAGNSKLVARAASIVSAITGTSQEQAVKSLAATNSQVKEAVLHVNGARDLAAAKKILSEAGGNLRLALAKLKPGV